MRVTCPHCSGKSVITSRNKISERVTDVYCQCMNTVDCGASFVATIAHKHDINPPARTAAQIAAELIRNLPANQRRELQMDLFSPQH